MRRRPGPLNNAFAAPEPAERTPYVASEGDLSVELALAATHRFTLLGSGARRGTAESAAFAAVMVDLRRALGLSRFQLAERSRLNPVYVAMLEAGLLGPDEIPAAAVANLALGLGRSLSELPMLPYETSRAPRDEFVRQEGSTRVRLGVTTLEPLVDALLRARSGPAAQATVRLPSFTVGRGSSRWQFRAGELTTAAIPGLASDEYSWQMVRGRSSGVGAGWSLFVQVADPVTARPANEIAVELRAGSQRRAAVSDRDGRLKFDAVDPADIEPLVFALLQST